MKDILWILILACIDMVSSLCDSTSSDVCKLYNNEELPHVYTRHPSIDYSSLTDDTKYCDLHALQHGTWYRSSYNLVTTCVDHRKCGTSDPIWLQTTLPSDSEETVDGTGCVRTLTDCCESTISLKIRNCTYYMVYCFIDLHPSCHSRFCVDTDLDIETTTTTTTTTTTLAPEESDDEPSQQAAVQVDNSNDGYTVYIVFVALLAVLFAASTSVIAYLLITKLQATKSKIGTSQITLCSRPSTAATSRDVSVDLNHSSNEHPGSLTKVDPKVD